ncbi:MAG: glycoside hydrolase family 16 protein [Bacillus subtilis]|nr:glycoside hydrolase family 16 protein [Bacillus subtilis]
MPDDDLRANAEFQYGRIEVRAKVPTAAKGSWPAIWMLPTEFKEGKTPWPKCGEIDIMEHVTPISMNDFHVSLHTELYNHVIRDPAHAFRKDRRRSRHEFHTYAMDWTKDSIEFFLDGKSFHRYEQNAAGSRQDDGGWPFDKPYYLILNIAIGGTWGGASRSGAVSVRNARSITSDITRSSKTDEGALHLFLFRSTWVQG